jgi:hypothetical protein
VSGSALLLFPAFHILTANNVSADKHVVFGFLIAAPVAGLGLDRVARHRILGVVAVSLFAGLLLAAGIDQGSKLDRAWPDEQPVAAFIHAHMVEGQSLLSTDDWQLAPTVYGSRLTSPDEMANDYDVNHGGPSFNVCRFHWIVISTGWNEWSKATLKRIESCHDAVVFRSVSTATDLNPSSRYVTFPVEFQVLEKRS